MKANRQLFSRSVARVHCVGVGGMGVGPLAIYLAQLGLEVTGEDDAINAEMRGQLERGGVAIAPLPEACELVVHSSAIPKQHPTLAAAAARGIRAVRRGEMLAEITRGSKLVAVCGSHGKTTTTAMLVAALRQANFPAGYVLGGLLADDAPPAAVGENEWVVAEIDESDGTIDRFAPAITVTVNLDWDHPDQYRRAEDLEHAFAALFARTRDTVLVSDACATSARVARTLPAPEAAGGRPAAQVFTFGRTGSFSGRIAGEEAGRMQLQLGGKFFAGEAEVRASGDFNAANATAALAAAQLMGADVSAAALRDYPGVRRRQSALVAPNELTVVEDYAHHPAEIRALLASLRQRVRGMGSAMAGKKSAPQPGRLLVAFQPHRFSRTAQFKAEFAAALAAADAVHLLDVYGAGEAPMAGGTTADIYAELKRIAPSLPVSYLPGDDGEFFRALAREVRGGDLVAFVGAGDIDKKARQWIEVFRETAMRAKIWDEFIAAVQPALGTETKLRREEPVGAKTTLRVGGAARIYAEPASAEDLRVLVRGAKTRGLEVYLFGRGSNLIVPDEGVDGLVVSLAHASWAAFEPREGGRVWAGAGLRLKNLCGLAAKNGLTGFEFLEGIPGSVGGALRMNAGAMGGWMFDVVEAVELMTLEGEVKTVPRAQMSVQYRCCAELERAIALGAVLRPLAQADTEAVSRQIDVYRRKRQESQPREPSAGCIFKNPPGNSAGRLIDESGLKGERVGDAEVSRVHANFIVNRGHASGADVLELVRRVRARVRQLKGVELEPEVLLYGKEWREVL
ncbi:MAG TPA: UDP-N-acetylmuramate dehydrogenase [Opitutus sp.]|nr:UDP-N-acetylmuramate dehydrogenase [Opitutus sp.]